MPAIEEGQVFASLQEFKDALREWAIERNFTPHILDSDSHRVRAGCRTAPDCPFRIRANYNEKRRNAKVTTVDDNHTCVSTSDQLVSQNIKRAEAGKLKFLLEAVPKLIRVDRKTKTDVIVQAIENRYGQTISVRQAQKVKRELSKKLKGPCRLCQSTSHSRRDCPQRPASTQDLAGARSGDLPDDIVVYSDAEMGDSSSSEERPRKPTHCSVCFQTGHNRKNCPEKDKHDASQAGNSASPVDPQVPAPTALMSNGLQNRVPLDPTLTNGFHPSIQRVAHAVQTLESSRPPVTDTEQATRGDIAPVRTRQATALEAARLMQKAGTLMKEAARLHTEAARLTASLANT